MNRSGMERLALVRPGRLSRGARPKRAVGRKRQLPSLQAVIGASIVIVVLETGAHHEPMLLVDSGVPEVEESMQVSPQGESVAHSMWPILRVGSDVGGLKDWQGMLLGHRTGAAIRVEHLHAEDALAKARQVRRGRTVPGRIRPWSRSTRVGCGHSELALRPDPQPF